MVALCIARDSKARLCYHVKVLLQQQRYLPTHLLHYLTDELTPCRYPYVLYSKNFGCKKTLANSTSIAKFFHQFFQQRGFVTLFYRQNFYYTVF